MRFFQRFSIRLRISLGSLLIAALLLGIAVVVFRAQVDAILNDTTKTLLQHDGAPSVSDVRNNPSGTVDLPGRGQLVAVVDPNGKVVETTLPKSLQTKMDTILKLNSKVTTIPGGDDRYSVLVQAIPTPFGSWHVVTARNNESATLLLDRLTQALIFGALVLVIAFGLASWMLTGASLWPVSRMRKQAEAIVSQKSTEPLPTGPARDELAALGTTLNEFILSVRKSVDRERQLLSDASHELRSPIAVLMTQLELAHLNTGNAKALEKEISAAQNSVRRLSALATSLLELSQLESQAPGGTSTWTDLTTELAASVDDARMAGSSSRVTIDFDVSRSASVLRGPAQNYPISASNFARIIGNLSSNAVAAMPHGGAVRITLHQSPLGVVLTVADTGPGMPPDFIPIAFDRFSRPDESRTRGSGGAGLGLAIVHAIVESARGEITLSNATGTAPRGLIVTITLPRKSLSRPVPV